MAKWRGYEDLPADAVGRAPKGHTSTPASRGADIFLDAVLYPNRSLTPQGFLIVMAIVAAVSLIVGVYFLTRGAWPITGFFGLDVLALYLAFRASYRSAKLQERVRIARDEMLVRRITPAGFEKRWRLQSYWVRVHLDEPVEHDSKLRLVSHGRSLVIGGFLPPRERREVAAAIRGALDRARAAPA